MGCKGLRVTREEDLPDVMAEFLATDEPVVLDAHVCKHEHGTLIFYLPVSNHPVYPMVPAGKALHEMELGSLKIDEPASQFHNSLISP